MRNVVEVQNRDDFVEIVINSNGSIEPEILVDNLYDKLVDIGYLKVSYL